MPRKSTNVCDEDRVGIVISAKIGIHIIQKAVSETEMNAKAYGQGMSYLFLIFFIIYLDQSFKVTLNSVYE